MNKIDELIEKIRQRPSGWDTVEFFEHDIETIMIEYAEWYAKKCLQMAAANVKFQYGYVDVEGSTHREIVDLDYEKTFCFKLPEHD